ncbi:hypothetical protein CC86DRAFT_326560 [Ophiobolus disseminans]|uniref:Uncharacterized protein n=1 Tax=Ophiobolus disseminans TaxID=1469910 RepID=A0A6A6ZSS3_9PLEO|nr:hypothetical protein CC86DRAFT_326560 [Ophiobolus disseminans]
MPSLPNFSDNPFHTRADLIHAASALIQPLAQYKSPPNARIKISTSTGAGFSETAAQLEGFARPLWVVADLLRLNAQGTHPDFGLETWVSGLKAGTDTASSEYWGDVSAFDQRMVEMESIAYALLLHPEAFSFADDPAARTNLITWLRQINEHDMPQSNWLWFRVLVNLALIKTLGVSMWEVKHHIDDALARLDSFHIGDGWSSDGLWCNERKQADYYSGSFAIQFAQLLFVRFAPEYDIERTERYKSQAELFARGYWRYFGKDGAAIPFGRSLTYRFAMAAFWAVVACAGVKLAMPVQEMGTVKGLLLRHLRWWAKHPHVFNTDGTLNIGYAYPNMYLAEDYNSPQSVYWCLKAFLVLGLDESHSFWTSEELPHPQAVEGSQLPDVELLWPPRHIMCNTRENHFLLSSGQSTSKRFKAREAKYGKFAYSSSLGFSVPCGSFLEQIAPDSTLAVSFVDGEDEWKVRWVPYDVETGEQIIGEETVSTLTSCWKPWKKEDLEVKTILVPPVRAWPGWHLRVHRIKWKPTSASTLRIVDGGFAASAQTQKDRSIFELPCGDDFQLTGTGSDNVEGWWSDDTKSLILSESGASGILDLTAQFKDKDAQGDGKAKCTSAIIRADPNTNLIYPRSLIPTVQHHLQAQNDEALNLTLVTGVFAVNADAARSSDDFRETWSNPPIGKFSASDGDECLVLGGS